jgi:dTDP-4-amino-4,6-dideoxygalactose transaminase
MIQIPAFDLERAVVQVAGEIEARWRSLTERTAFVGGAEVETFEREFAEYLSVAGCVGVANGTDALELALRALDLRPGDEVVVPAFTFIATAAAVSMAGGRPVFADVENTTLNLDPDDLRQRIGDRTVGVIGVHLYGRPFEVDAVTEICRQHELWLIEDAAQAHGARWRGRTVGSFGSLSTWSFYPSKNLGCFGDGGAVTGSDSALLNRVRLLANHGRTAHYEHSEVGRNSRLDALQAAVLGCRLPGLEADNERRRAIAGIYRRNLSRVGDLRLLEDRPETTPVYHQMTVLTSRREELREYLASRGIGSSIHYPRALHLQPAFASSGQQMPELPVAAAAGEQVLCLPMYPQLTDHEIETVCDAVTEFFVSR